MQGFPGLRFLDDGVISENLLRALTLDDLRGLGPCNDRLARLLAGSTCWLYAAIAEAPFLQLEASSFPRGERAGVIRALRVLRKAVPARGLKAPLDSACRIEKLAGAVKAASLASALHVQCHGGFAAPLVGLLRWKDEAALLGALCRCGAARCNSGEFCLSAPVTLPQRESQQLVACLGLGVVPGPPLSMRIVFAWKDGRLMAAVSLGGLVPERLTLPQPATSGFATRLLVQVTIHCLEPELPLPTTSLTIPVGRQWVAVPLELPEDTESRSAATAAMVRGALCVMTVTDFEIERQALSVNTLQLHPLRDGLAA
jgi:hypothetical protein